jgi:hypothetical protein
VVYESAKYVNTIDVIELVQQQPLVEEALRASEKTAEQQYERVVSLFFFSLISFHHATRRICILSELRDVKVTEMARLQTELTALQQEAEKLRVQNGSKCVWWWLWVMMTTTVFLF